MKPVYLFIAAMLGIGLGCSADTIEVASFRYAGPYVLPAPFELDSIDAAAKKYDAAAKLALPVSLDLVKSGSEFSGPVLPGTAGDALHLLSFTLDNSRFSSAEIKVEGIGNFEMYVDGVKTEPGQMELVPGTREVVLKCFTDTSSSDTLKVSLVTSAPECFTVNPASGRRYSTRDIFTGRFIGLAAVSPSGKYLYSGYYYVNKDGSYGTWEYVLSDVSTGRELCTRSESMKWMPKSDILYYTRERDKRIQLVTFDPATGMEHVAVDNLPDRHFTISPTEDFMVYTQMVDGPKEKNQGLYQILTPQDRQPGWRNRGRLMKFDFATGLSTPLTFGYKSVSLSDISADGRKVLFSVSESDLGKRPSSLSSLYLLDLSTMKAECIVEKDGFIGASMLSPDGRTVAVQGSPEAFGGIGKNLPDSLVPSMADMQLFIVDVSSRHVTPLTRDFNPSVDKMKWCRADGCIYFSAEDRDCMPLFRVNPVTGKIESLCVSEDYVFGYSVACDAPVVAYYGQSADSASRLYTIDAKKMKSTLRYDMNDERTTGLWLDKTHDWSYKSTRGDTIYARYNLPPDFDPAKKYPVVVYYYGGCSPIGRYFDTTYNPHLFAANGYIFLVINPSGATGFGQEFSARHVATAGEGVAQDIIDGVKQFVSEHSFVDADRIGCCGASYGGFMTQYLQTVTDIFAAAISHAGISDHTSYWGEGYWGYSYSEVSMADKFPWTDRELYVSHSPLYNADKINTPILFLHGDADNNVPFGESIQMFTALKLLGKDAALVAVKDQDHHILDFNKRELWINTMLAWFGKYLQGDSAWWNSMYPEKEL